MAGKFWGPIKKFFQIVKGMLTFNITTIIFSALFIYMIITLILYATSIHVTSFQVTAGPLTKNPVCTALAIRSEQVVPAGETGYIEYYAHEGMQVRREGSVYAMYHEQQTNPSIELSEEQMEKLRSNMAKFSYGFDGNNFYDTYSFKYEVQGTILQAAAVHTGQEENTNIADMEEVMQQAAAQTPEESTDGVLTGQAVGSAVPVGKQTVYTAPEAGIVIYATDGYEEKTEENLTEEDFNQKSYHKEDLLTNEEVKSGEPVYKMITSENWTLMVPVTDKLAATIGDRETIKVKFNKDGETQNGTLSIVNIGNQKVAKIDLVNGMIRYASDRFLEVELVVNTISGLKIPVSSIITKEFYVIPREFLVNGENGEGRGFLRVRQGGSDSDTTEFVDTVIYKEVIETQLDAQGKEMKDRAAENVEGGYCFVDKETFQENDVLTKQDSAETFVVGNMDYLEGVYCINKGYTVFRQIEILDQNEEYCIVSQGTSYGLQAFDYIVLDGESVNEEDILYTGVH